MTSPTDGKKNNNNDKKKKTSEQISLPSLSPGSVRSTKVRHASRRARAAQATPFKIHEDVEQKTDGEGGATSEKDTGEVMAPEQAPWLKFVVEEAKASNRRSRESGRKDDGKGDRKEEEREEEMKEAKGKKLPESPEGGL